MESGRDAQRGGLAGTVRSEQRDDTRFGHFEVDAEEHVDTFVRGAHPAQLEQVHGADLEPLPEPLPEPRYAASTASLVWISSGVPAAMI